MSDDLPWTTGDSPAILNGAGLRSRCRPHSWPRPSGSWPCLNEKCAAGTEAHEHCLRCSAVKRPTVIRRNRNNTKRGGWFERWLVKHVPGWRGVGPLKLPWDGEVGEYAQMQAKYLVGRPSANAIRALILAIPYRPDRLRGLVWGEPLHVVKGKRVGGRREASFLGREWRAWHGTYGEPRGRAGYLPLATSLDIITLPLAEWVDGYIEKEISR